MGMSVPTDLTVEASASGTNFTQDDESPAEGSVADTDSLVFICYRRDDGHAHADWIDRALNGWEWTRPTGMKSRVRTYFDRTAPAVADWRKHHFPSLRSAQSLILVCTPGAAKDLSAPGKPDWLYEELRWWIAKRTHPPIVVDVTADAAKWVPEPILQKWPNINRVQLRLADAQSSSGAMDERYLARWREQLEQTLHESERATNFDKVAQLDQLTHRLRQRARVLSAALMAVAALAVISLWFFHDASRARDSSQALNRFLGSLFFKADPDQMRGKSLTAGELLDAGVREARASREPSVQVDMLAAIGAAYNGLGQNETAISVLDEAAGIAEKKRIPRQTLFNLALARGEALLYQKENRFKEARELLERALELSPDGPDRSHTLVALGDADAWAPDGDRRRAAERYRQAITIDRSLNDLRNEARDRNRLGYLAKEMGDRSAAKEHFAAASALVRQAGETSGSLLIAKYDHDQAAALYEDGDLAGALTSFELARHQLAGVYGDDSASVAIADNNIARLAIEQGGDLAGVEQRLTHAVAALKAKLGPKYADLSKALNSLGLTQRERGDRGEARKSFESAREIAEANKDHSIAAQALIHLAETSMAEDRLAEARSDLQQALTHFPSVESRTGWRFGLYEGALAELAIASCDLPGAEEKLRRSDEALSERWKWSNMFRRANERRWELLKIAQTNDTPRCRGASKHG